MNDSPDIQEPEDAESSVMRLPLLMGGGLLALVLLYLLAGQFLGGVNASHLPPHELASGSSHIVDVNARILEREMKTGWAPSARFVPIWDRTDMRYFQEGMLDVVTKATQELNHVFRVGSESKGGKELMEAANDVDRPATDWSIFSANSTVDRLSDAVKRLDHVNERLAHGDMPSVSGRIDLVANQISDYVALLSDEHTRLEHVASKGHWLFGARGPFYHAQGVLTGVCLELTAAREDFKKVLELQSALGVFDQATAQSCATLDVRPLPVVNGSGYSLFGGNIKTLSEHIGTVLYNLSAVQSALAAGPHGAHP